MEMHKIICKDVMNHICDNLGEELDSPKCIEIKAHLEDCECCRSYRSSIDSTIRFYKEYNVEVTEDIHKRLMEFLENKK
jgi:hypothetical protein